MTFLLAERDDRAEAATTRTQGRLIGLALIVTILATCAALTGCGGGDPEDDTATNDATTQPIDCAAHPDSCK